MSASAASSDFLFFAGHGDPGLMALYNGETTNSPPDTTSWGPGPTDHSFANNMSGFPVGGKLKWIFAFSSMTAAPPASLYPNNADLTTDWSPAFGGSLHGIYGFAVRPLANGSRSPDVTLLDATKFNSQFLARAMTVNPMEGIHSSWIHGANDVSKGDQVGVWEDGANYGDELAADSSGLNIQPGGEIWYYWVEKGFEHDEFVGSPTAIGSDTFSLQPASLAPEPLSDSAMLSNAQPYFGDPDTYTNDGSVSTATKGGTTIVHDLRTGGLTFHGVAQINPAAFSQNDAYSSATQAVQSSTNGMPGDAVLTRVDVNSKMDVASGGTSIIGYTFTWRHASQPFGNDAISVTIDDVRSQARQCTGGYDTWYDQMGRPHSFCSGWTTTITNTQNVSYMFRMWRTRSGSSSRQPQSLGQPSLTAATAAASLPPNTSVYDYRPGFWTGTFNDPTNNVAVPAWVFTLVDGTQIYVDAYSGALLQAIKS